MELLIANDEGALDISKIGTILEYTFENGAVYDEKECLAYEVKHNPNSIVIFKKGR
jgi:hypothetical protein